MPKVTIRNNRRVSVIWGSFRFPARSERTIEIDEARLGRLRHKRGLRLVGVHDEVPAADGAPAWGSTVKSAMEYVGDDAARAAEVLEAEQAGKARKSLVEQLEAVIESAGDDGGENEADAGDGDGDESDAGDGAGED